MAVKTPLPKALATQSGRARFLREAEAWIGLGLHPNICAAYYVGIVGGVPRLFIEFIDGGSLDHWIKNNIGASTLQLLDLAIQIASGMQHAHTFHWVDEDGEQHQGVVHRDLKPANVLIGSDGIARVTDFGLVGRGSDSEVALTDQEAPEPITQTGGIWGTVTLGGSAIGTPPYMPPEQWDRAHLAAGPADIYAFGCILYEMFCGRRMFVLDEKQRRARPEAQLLFWRDLHRNASPPPPHEFSPELDDQLASLMVRCVAKDPDDRPPGFDVLREHLKGIYARMAGSAYPRPEPHASRLTADALNNRAVSFVTLGQEQRAERAWREALSVDPHHTEANYNLALFRWRARGASDPDTSVSMEEVRRAQASLWRDEHLSGRIALILGRWEDSLDNLRKAVHACNGSPEVARDCGLALCAMAHETADQGLWKEASDLLSRCGGPLRMDPTLLAAYALAQQRLGNPEVAIRLYSSACHRADNLPDDFEAGVRRLLPGQHLQKVLPGLTGRLYGIAADTTMSTAATLMQDGKIHIWDCVDGSPTKTLRPQGPRPRCIAMNPSGRRLLTATEGDPVNVWDLKTEFPVNRLQPHAGFLNGLTVTDDGRRAAAVGTVGSVIIWDLASRTILANHTVHSGFLTCLAVAQDNSTCIIGGSNGFVLLFNLDEGQTLARLRGHENVVTAVAVDSQSQLAASGDSAGTIDVWDTQEGLHRHRLQGHTGTIRFLSLRCGGAFCLSASADGTARVWDLVAGRPVLSVQLGSEVFAGVGSRDWRSILLNMGVSHLLNWRLDESPAYRPAWAVATPVTVGEAEERSAEFADKIEAARILATKHLYDKAFDLVDQARSISGYERMTEALDLSGDIAAIFPREDLRAGWEESTIEGHVDRVTDIAIDERGAHLATVAADRRLVFWDLETDALKREWDTGVRPETSVAFVPGTRSVVTGGLDNNLHLSRIDTGECTLVFSGHEAQVNQVAADHRGQYFLSASADGTARLWDVETGICLRILSGHIGEVFCCTFSPDGKFAATGGSDGVIIWNLETGTELTLLGSHSGAVEALAWSGDERFLLSAGRDTSLRLWDLEKSACLLNLDCDAALLTVALSPDDRYAATGDKDGKVRLWDLKTSNHLRTFAGHQGDVLAAKFSPDGRRLFTAGADGLVKVWYLDWKPTILPPADWDNRLVPYLEVFLAGRGGESSGRPRWSRADFGRLVGQLAHRGFGWVREEGIRERLKAMTLRWSGHTSVGTALLEQGKGKRPGTPKRRRSLNIRRRAIVFAAAALVLFVVFAANRISHSIVHFDKRSIIESRRTVMESVVPPISEFTRAIVCQPIRFNEYLETFTESKGEIWEIEGARHCLEVLGDPDAVGPALDMLRPRTRPFGPGGASVEFRVAGGYTEVLSLLTRMGDSNCNELAQALLDSDPVVRTVAGRALSYRGSEMSIQTLLDLADDREPLVRIAVSSTLQEIVSSGRIKRQEALRLFEKLAEDNWPEVRRRVATNLRILGGTGARKLARQLAQDRDKGVRQMAKETLIRLD